MFPHPAPLDPLAPSIVPCVKKLPVAVSIAQRRTKNHCSPKATMPGASAPPPMRFVPCTVIMAVKKTPRPSSPFPPLPIPPICPIKPICPTKTIVMSVAVPRQPKSHRARGISPALRPVGGHLWPSRILSILCPFYVGSICLF